MNSLATLFGPSGSSRWCFAPTPWSGVLRRLGRRRPGASWRYLPMPPLMLMLMMRRRKRHGVGRLTPEYGMLDHYIRVGLVAAFAAVSVLGVLAQRLGFIR